MRILYLHQYFRTPDNPGGTRSYEMARRFVAAGHDVLMVTSDDGAERRFGQFRHYQISGIDVYSVAVPYSHNMSYPKRIKAFFQFCWYAARRSSQLRADVVFATSTPLTIAIPGVYAAKRLRVPLVFEVRDLWPEAPIAIGALKNPLLIRSAQWLERFAYRNSAHVVALSPGMADGVAQAGYPRNQISVIPNCCNVEMFKVAEREKQKFRESHPQFNGGPLVVYAGTFGTANGVQYLVEIAFAMRSLDPSVKFLIVGDGLDLNTVQRRARELNILNENLWIMPTVPKKSIPAILSSATVATSLFIELPVLWHNSANKFFDALAAGRPVMINYRGWQEAVLKETGAGISVPPSEPRAAAILLHDFLNDDQRLARARQAAAQLARTRFDQDLLAEELLSVLTREADRQTV